MITCSTLHAVPTPCLMQKANALPTGATIAITPDQSGIATVLAQYLIELGYRAQITETLPLQADAVILLDALQPFETLEQAIQINEKTFERIQSIAAHFSENGGKLIAVQNTGGQFGLTDMPDFAAWAAGLSGLIKTAAQEWPKASCKIIDLQCADQTPIRLVEQLLPEILYKGDHGWSEIGLLADGRRVALSVTEKTHPHPVMTLKENDVVLVTGGGRGVTSACLIALAHQIKLRLVLFGRTALVEDPEICRSIAHEAELKQNLFTHYQQQSISVTPKDIQTQVNTILSNREIRSTLTQLEILGSNVIYLAVDVLNETTLRTAIENVRKQWGNIAGIIHGAGVLADKLIAQKTLAQFQMVFQTKVSGLKNLLTVTQSDHLKLLALFSSVAGRFGNPGQCDYAMANEVLNKVAQQYKREHPQCVVKSINWGPWESGMVSPQLKQLFLSRGVALIPISQGADLFVNEITSTDEAVEIVVGGTLNPNESTALQNLEQTFSVDIQSHPYLASHIVKDIPVLPVCLALEWMITVAKKYDATLSTIRVENFRVLHGIQLKLFFASPEYFVVKCLAQKDNRLYLTLSAQNALVPNYSLEILKDIKSVNTQVDVEKIESSMGPWPYNVNTIYANTAQTNILFHGPDFHSIDSLQKISDESATAIIHGVNTQSWPGTWHTDALAIDTIFQLGILWGKCMSGKLNLPSAFAACEISPQIPINNLYIILLNTQIKGHRIMYDAILQQEDGQIYARFKQVEGVFYDV